MIALLLAGCAGGGQEIRKGSPEPTAEDREVSQLLATARIAERRWHSEVARQRKLRERVLEVSSAAGLALARKELSGLANRSVLQVRHHTDGEPSQGTYIRSHPVTLHLVGQPRALVSFLVTLERLAPRFRLGDLMIKRQRGEGAMGYEATLGVDVLERVAVPPPLFPPPAPPPVPLDTVQAVRVLRSHILELDKSLQTAAKRTVALQTAANEVWGASSPTLSGPLAALFPRNSSAQVMSAAFSAGKLTANAQAPTEDDARLWADAVDRHRSTSPGIVVDFELKTLEDGSWTQIVEIAGTTPAGQAVEP